MAAVQLGLVRFQARGLEQVPEHPCEVFSSEKTARSQGEQRGRRTVLGCSEEPSHGPDWAGGGVCGSNWHSAGGSERVSLRCLDGKCEAVCFDLHVSSEQVASGRVLVGGWSSKLPGPQEGVKT